MQTVLEETFVKSDARLGLQSFTDQFLVLSCCQIHREWVAPLESTHVFDAKLEFSFKQMLALSANPAHVVD